MTHHIGEWRCQSLSIKREACARYGHQPEWTPRGTPPAWYCRRCGDRLAQR